MFLAFVVGDNLMQIVDFHMIDSADVILAHYVRLWNQRRQKDVLNSKEIGNRPLIRKIYGLIGRLSLLFYLYCYL